MVIDAIRNIDDAAIEASVGRGTADRNNAVRVGFEDVGLQNGTIGTQCHRIRNAFLDLSIGTDGKRKRAGSDSVLADGKRMYTLRFGGRLRIGDVVGGVDAKIR